MLVLAFGDIVHGVRHVLPFTNHLLHRLCSNGLYRVGWA